jgi:hypothetical protein
LTTPRAYFFSIINEVTKEVPRRPIPEIPLKGKQGALYRGISSIEAVEE